VGTLEIPALPTDDRSAGESLCHAIETEDKAAALKGSLIP
jgi:hypothetical protein